jgi:hypothetical protein
MEIQSESSNQTIAEAYEPPALVAVGEFSEDTLGFGSSYTDIIGEHV